MIYFANPSTSSVREIMARGDLGFMATPKQGNPIPAGVTWAADNGAFTETGRAGFTTEKYLTWLASYRWAAGQCVFATAPDVLGDPQATWENSREVLPIIRDLGYPAALVAQNGVEYADIDWPAFDVLFIGGTTSWKLGCRGLVAEAKTRGKWVHMGRVNSERRLRNAASMGCDSVDGTYLTFGPDTNLPKLTNWLDRLDRMPALPMEWTA